MNSFTRSLLPLVLAAASAISPQLSFAGTPAPGEPPTAADKAEYNLFHPVPRELMRELNTDRPDTTEGPGTVDAGHVQIEMSLFDFSRERSAGTRTDTWTFGATDIRIGVLNNVEFNLIFDAYTSSRERSGKTVTHSTGFSDLTLRTKINLWGNDGGSTAFALLPYLKLPTGTRQSNDNVEGGLILPFNWDVNDKFSIGSMLQADVVYDEGARRHHVEWVHSVTFGYSVLDPVMVYVEYVGIASGQRGFDYLAYFDTGATLQVAPDVQFDAGVRIGLTQATEDFGVFSGVAVRF